MNKDNAATATAATSENSKAKEHAISVSAGSAQKVLDLACAVFQHQDSKKGQHDSVILGFRLIPAIPTTTAMGMLHANHEPFYMTYLEQICLKKDSQTLMNIEENVLRGFSCPK